MNILFIKGTNQFPEVNLDRLTGELAFSGNCLPEDVKAFFEPILEWITAYLASPSPQTTLKFRMSYYNTPTSKIFYQILKRFEPLVQQGRRVKVIWYYPIDDPDMREAGADLSENIRLPFEFVSYEDT